MKWFTQLSRSPRFPALASAALALLCGTLSLLPVWPGIRIPVPVSDKRMGYLTEHGWMVEPARWKYASPFDKDGFGHVSGPGYWRISRTGKLKALQPPPMVSMPDPRWRPVGPDAQGMTLVWEWSREPGQPPRCHWLGKDGKPAFPGSWDGGQPFGDHGLAAVLLQNEWGFIDRQGNTVIAHAWDATRGFGVSRFAPVMRNGRWGVIDMSGKLVVPPRFHDLTAFDADGMAVARLEGFGFVNPQGRFMIPPVYQQCEPFDQHGMARAVNREGKCGWIGRDGATRVPFLYDAQRENPYFPDLPLVLPVALDGLGGLIDRSGRVVVPPAAGSVRVVTDPLAPEREWYVRVPANAHQHRYPYYPPYGERRVPVFEPACYDENGRRIWPGWDGGKLSSLPVGWRGLCRVLAGLAGLFALVLFALRRRRMKRAAVLAARRDAPFIRKPRG